MDLQLLNELAERNIAGTYMESKFFLNPANAHVLDQRDLAEVAFVAIMCLYVLYETPHTRKAAAAYASNTMKWDMTGTFARHRIQASDLYISLQALHDYERSQIAGQLKKSENINAVQLQQMRVAKSKQPVKRFLLDVMYYQLQQPAVRFFFNLETQFYVVDSTLRTLRRNVGDWHSISKAEKIYTISRLTLWLKRHAPKYDMIPLMNQLLDARDIDVN